MSRTAFLEARPVSRETLDRLDQYETLLKKWNPAINLVSKSTLDQAWTRHFLDSAQLFDLAPADATTWSDFGSGGGLPGLVIACLAAEERPDLRVTLVESDQRKAAFLMSAARALQTTVQVFSVRAESLAPMSAGVASARALAPLADLIGIAHRHLASNGVAIFPKGARHHDELQQALENWRFSYETIPSLTDPDAVIYRIMEIERA